MTRHPLPKKLSHDFAAGHEGWVLHDPQAKLATCMGRKALEVSGGTPILAPVNPVPPYTVRTTLCGGPGECYAGVCFHLQDVDNHETIYLAPAAGGKPEAIQYDPVINGSTTWQVFGDADGLAVAPLESQRWHRLRIDVWPEIAQVYVDDETAALTTFPLRSGFRNGRVGLWGYLPSYFADFAVAPLGLPQPSPPPLKVTPPAGTITAWLVARLDASDGALRDLTAAASEHNGALCLNRLYRAEPEARALAAAEVQVPAGADEVVLELGYSDHARVWWDEALVHEGEWRWNPPAGADGRIRPGQTRVTVPATAGRHPLFIEVQALEPGFGWGLTARALAGGAPLAWRQASEMRAPPEPGGPSRG